MDDIVGCDKVTSVLLQHGEWYEVDAGTLTAIPAANFFGGHAGNRQRLVEQSPKIAGSCIGRHRRGLETSSMLTDQARYDGAKPFVFFSE